MAASASRRSTGFVCLATFSLHPFAAGRTYAAYGGMYITVALIWLWAVDGITLSRWDLIGATVALLGMAIIASQP